MADPVIQRWRAFDGRTSGHARTSAAGSPGPCPTCEVANARLLHAGNQKNGARNRAMCRSRGLGDEVRADPPNGPDSFGWSGRRRTSGYRSDVCRRGPCRRRGTGRVSACARTGDALRPGSVSCGRATFARAVIPPWEGSPRSRHHCRQFNLQPMV
jgi:hypothetical protein